MRTIIINNPGPQGATGPQGVAGPSGSTQPFSNVSGSIWATTSSLEVSGSFTVSGSSTFTNIGPAVFSGSVNATSGVTMSSAVVSGDVTVLGTASINVLQINTTINSTGSNTLGDSASDTQTLYGSVVIPTGSLTVSGAIAATNNILSQYASSRITTTPTSNTQTFGFNSLFGGEDRMFVGYVGNTSTYGTTLSAYFGSPAGYKLSFGTGNNIHQTIFGTGNVAIGTTTDSGYKLDVNGTARISSTIQSTGFYTNAANGIGISSPATAIRISTNDNGANIIANSTPYFTFGNNGTAITRTSGTGKWFELASFVSFAPTSGTTTMDWLSIAPTINQTGGANGITRGIYINPTLTAAADWRAIETTSGSVIFNHGATSLLFVSSSGRVGIGTTTPANLLELYANGSYNLLPDLNTHLSFRNAIGYQASFNLTSDGWLRFYSATGYVFYGTSNTQIHLGSNSGAYIGSFNDSLKFGTNGGTERMRLVATTGNVLIGTTTDAGYKLDVSGSTRLKGNTIIEPVLDNNALYISSSYSVLTVGNADGFIKTLGIRLGLSSNNGLISFTRDSSGVMFGQFNQNGLSYLNTGGNFSIGTTSDVGGKLSVRGSGTTSATTALRVENTNASASIVVLDNGYVGINTGSADYNLDVNGTARISGLSLTLSANNPQLIWNTGAFGLYNGSTRLLRVDYLGNYQFQQSIIVAASSATTINASAILEANSTTRGFLPPRTNTTASISSPAQGLMTYLTGSTNEGLYYYNSGSQVGWHRVLTNTGSQSITGSLEVSSTARFNGDFNLFRTDGIQFLNVSNAGAAIDFNPGNNAAPTFRVRGASGVLLHIKASEDKVGINNTAPTAMLHVRGSGTTSATTALRVENTNASASMVVLDNGFVGINTGSAQYNLDVNGTLRTSGFIYSNAYATSVQRLQFNNGVISGNIGYVKGIADGVIQLADVSELNFNRLQFGGATTSFPALQRVSASLAIVDATGGTSGSLLIGTTSSAGYALDVVGNQRNTSLFSSTTLTENGLYLANTTEPGFYTGNASPSIILEGRQKGGGSSFVSKGRLAFLPTQGATVGGDFRFEIWNGSSYSSALVSSLGSISIASDSTGQISYIGGGSSTIVGPARHRFVAGGPLGGSPSAGVCLVGIANTYSQASTSNSEALLRIFPTINQTAAGTGIFRGMHVDPTITSITATDGWRSIEWSNNTGWGLYGSGSALNYLNGNTLIGTTTDSGAKLTVRGAGTTNATTTLNVQNSAGTELFKVFDGGQIYIPQPAGTSLYLDTLAGYNTDRISVPRLVTGTGVSGMNASAQVEIQSTTKGFLPPRMTNAQRVAISTPAVGLMVYCTDATEGLYIYKSTGWTFIV